MGRGVGRGAQIALNHMSIKVYHHHVLGFHRVIVDSAGFDDHKTCGAVDTRHIAPSEYNKSVFYQIKIGTKHFFF